VPDAEMRAAEVLAEYDDGIMAAYVDDEAGIPAERLRVALAAQTRRALVNPVFFGSAITGAGTDAIMAGIAELLPSAVGDAGAPTAGSVFKIERGAGGEKVAYVRMFAGTVRTRDRLRFGSPPPEQWSAGRDGPAGMQPGGGQADRARGGRVTAIAVFERGPAAERPSVSAGQIAKLWGLDRIQVGDHVWHETANRARAAGLPRGDGTSPPGQPADNGGQPRGQRSNQAPADQASLRRAPHDATPRGATPRGPAPEDPAPGDPSPRDGAGPGLSSDDRAPHRFARPTLESVVVPVRPGDRARLRVALGQLAEQDPLINVRQDDSLGEISVSLYGEVQKEVIAATLASDFGVEVTFRETTTICIERPLGSGEAAEVMGATGNPFPATLGLRVDAAPAGSGLAFRLDVGVRSVPLYVYKTTGSFAEIMTRNVRHALAEGLHGWEVTDCTVTLNRCAYVSPNTTAAHFRKLTPLVLLPALAQAGTVACEPMARMSIEIPADTSAAVLAAVARLGGVVETRPLAGGLSLVETVLPAARVQELQRRLPGLTNGEGVAETSFGGYRPVPGAPPVRRRTMPNPLNREEYLMYLTRPGALPH
jgi:ribosomal protection tetracycline resistance protein